MKKNNLKNKKFVYCYDNIPEVCAKHGSYCSEYFASNPDDPEFIIIEEPAEYCGLNDNGEEVWEIDGKKYAFVPNIGGEYNSSEFGLLRISKELPGVIMEEDFYYDE